MRIYTIQSAPAESAYVGDMPFGTSLTPAHLCDVPLAPRDRAAAASLLRGKSMPVKIKIGHNPRHFELTRIR